jgi:adenylylsulfate kinase-like enzyme
MIFWLTGQPGAGKTVLGKKLKKQLELLFSTNVFHLDGDDLRSLSLNQDYSVDGRIRNIENAQLISEYLSVNGNIVVVSLVSPYRKVREDFKKKIGSSNIVEFYIHTSQEREREHFKVGGYEPPLENFFDIDTTTDTPDVSLMKIMQYIYNREENV